MTDNMREKLVELLDEAENQYLEAVSSAESSEERYAIVNGAYGFYADHLIANNATVQEWIPVSERLPKKDESVLVYFDTGNMAVGYWYDKDECISFWQIWTDDGWVSDADCEPIYWMPLPEAPKGE